MIEELGETTVVEAEVHADLLRRILATAEFQRSPQLSKLLLYICTETFEGRGQSLNEHHVGVEVFGREPDYDSAADTIVRSHALRLRRRLEQYFQRAGAKEPVQLIIPRGGYTPVFCDASPPADGRRSGETESPEIDAIGSEDLPAPIDMPYLGAPAIPTSIPGAGGLGHPVYTSLTPFATPQTNEIAGERPYVHEPPTVYRTVSLLLAVACVGLLVALGVSLHALHEQARVTRNHPLWGRLFTNNQPTHIVLGDSGMVLFHATARRYVSLQDYLSGDLSKQMPFVRNVQPSFARFLAERRYTSVVDADTLAHLLHLPEATPQRTLVQYSRDMRMNDFKSGNVIIMGAQEAVPWVELFEPRMNFVFSIDTPTRKAVFLNRHPLPGEQAVYDPNLPGSRRTAYAVLAFVPNLSGNGSVLIMEGISMSGTEAAADLVTDDARLLPILQTIQRKDGSLPYFELLLESDTVSTTGESEPAKVISIHLEQTS